MSAGQIHDLGYKRYVGSRRARGTRWRVILRHQLATAWRSWWRYKVWLIAALMVTAAGAGMIYLTSGQSFQMFAGMAGQTINIADGTLTFLLPFYWRLGFFVGVLIGTTVVAGDAQSGAFTFYFARSARPRDYVAGKLGGLVILMAALLLVGPLLIALLRLGLASSTDELIATLPIVPKALAISALATLVYAAVPLGFSALIANRRYAMALWGAYYYLLGSMLAVLGLLVMPVLGALDLTTALEAVSLRLFDFRVMGRHIPITPLGPALASIAVHCTAAIAIVAWRVREAQRSGVVGSS